MPRPPRIEYDGAWYHIYNRGAGRCATFLTREDYNLFYELLDEIYQTWNVQTHAYSLMKNHYHLLIHTPNSNLSKAIGHLGGVYTQRFNRRHKTDGSLFKGRFKSIVVERESYLLQLVRYIHLNPVEAGIVKLPAAHRWTSHRSYLKIDYKPAWLFTDEVLLQFGKQRKAAAQKLDLFVKEGIDDETKKIFSSKKWPEVIGSNGFKDWINYNFVENSLSSEEIPEKRNLARNTPSFNDVLRCVAASYNVSINSLFTGLQGRDNEARYIAIYLMRKLIGATHIEIGRVLRTASQATIAKNIQRFQQKLRESKLLQKRYDALAGNIMSNVKA